MIPILIRLFPLDISRSIYEFALISYINDRTVGKLNLVELIMEKHIKIFYNNEMIYNLNMEVGHIMTIFNIINEIHNKYVVKYNYVFDAELKKISKKWIDKIIYINSYQPEDRIEKKLIRNSMNKLELII